MVTVQEFTQRSGGRGPYGNSRVVTTRFWFKKMYLQQQQDVGNQTVSMIGTRPGTASVPMQSGILATGREHRHILHPKNFARTVGESDWLKHCAAPMYIIEETPQDFKICFK